MKTIFSVCSGIDSIFQIFPLTVNQRPPETATLLPSGLVYLLLCFLSKVSTYHLLRLLNVCLLLKRKNRPFYRYGGHIELIRFKEYYRMLRGHEHISFVLLSAFRNIIS